MKKELFLSLFQPKKGNLIDGNNNSILLPEIPFYGISGTICRVEEACDCYYKVVYNQDGSISPNKIPVPKKKKKNFNFVLRDYCEDIEKYLVKYQSKYLECENSMDNPIFTDRQYYLLMVVTLLATIASFPFLFTTAWVGLVFGTISSFSLYMVYDLHKKDTDKIKSHTEFKKNYKKLQRDLVRYQANNPLYKVRNSETIYTEIKNKDKSDLKMFPKIKRLMKEEG